MVYSEINYYYYADSLLQNCRPNQILPSFLKRKNAIGGGGKAKRPKTVLSWDKDIVCLPNYLKKATAKSIPYPRGKMRAMLGREGLIGKVHLTSVMTIEEVKQEIRSVFQGPMGGKATFNFTFLQATGGSSRSLSVPSVSSSFEWTAQQVAKLGNQRNTIYILAEDELTLVSISVKMSLVLCTQYMYFFLDL